MMVMSKFRGGKGQAPTFPVILKTVVETLCPSQPLKKRYSRAEGPTEMEATIVTDVEVIQIAERFGNAQTPGLDGIPNKDLKTAIKYDARPFFEFFGIDVNKKLTYIFNKAIEGKKWMYVTMEYCTVMTFNNKNGNGVPHSVLGHLLWNVLSYGCNISHSQNRSRLSDTRIILS